MPIYWAFLTYMLLRESSGKPPQWLSFEGLDKIIHLLIFAILGFVFKMAFRSISFRVFFIVIAMYGLTTEVLQHLMNLGRSMEMIDLFADILGGILGYFMSIQFLKIIKK